MSLPDLVGLLGILIGLGLLIWFAFKGWSVLLLAPIAAVAAALFSREPLLAHWTQTFMRSAAGFFAQFFPLFLLGALFGKLMEDSGSVTAIADFMTQRLGAKRAILAVVLGGAIVTYGGVPKRRGEGFGDGAPRSAEVLAGDQTLRERATTAREFDPAEIGHGKAALTEPSIVAAAAPIVVVILVNLVLSRIVLPRLDLSFLAKPEWGGTSPSAVTGVWSVMTALTCAILAVLALNLRRIPDLRGTMDAGVNASALPAISVASLVGFGAVVAAMPAFAVVRDAVLGVGGGPLVSLAVATNILAALTGSASGGLTIALDALGPTYLERAAQIGMDPALLHRVAVIGSGTLDSLPHNGAVVTLLAVCGSTHTESYKDIFMVAIVGAISALAAVIAIGSALGSF